MLAYTDVEVKVIWAELTHSKEKVTTVNAGGLVGHETLVCACRIGMAIPRRLRLHVDVKCHIWHFAPSGLAGRPAAECE